MDHFMKPVFDPAIARKIEASGIIAVLVIESWQGAVPLAQALLSGGINVIELTLRTPAALEAIRAISSEVPEMTVGAGTILTPAQLEAVAASGAAFGVSPGFNRRVVKAAKAQGFSFAPGILTPSEMELAVEEDCRLLKFFPAEPIGGLKYLRTILSPFIHLGLKFIPLGGLNVSSVPEYLSDPHIAAIGGSWLAPPCLVKEAQWSHITALAQEVTSSIELSRRNVDKV
jgi:2-dehydro-3-deoxyphosphogluconate aldolase/(4S)-4-hydroxy-2-oxoglutarate aldolase